MERLTDVPVVGEIPLGKKPEQGAIVVHENRNDIMEETFRGLRTNLLFMLRPEERVIMFSSTMPGEGKSFVAGNLAVSLAFMGKKVLIMGMDIRKPGLNKVFNLTRRGLGMTSYLSDPDHTDLFDMIQHSDISPNLDVLPGGPIPPNPTELVARHTLDEAIARLKERYDYLILDTAPIGMVTDSVLISRVADMLVYVCRADYTPKGGFSFINTLRDEHKIPHLRSARLSASTCRSARTPTAMATVRNTATAMASRATATGMATRTRRRIDGSSPFSVLEMIFFTSYYNANYS